MVLVHGITDTWRTWELLLPHLESRHDALAITLLGHSGGRALSVDGGATLSELADEAERDMDAAGMETAHLVGNSLGGWIVLELATRGRARSVVALSPAGGWDPGNRWALASYWQLVAIQRSISLTEPIAVWLATRPAVAGSSSAGSSPTRPRCRRRSQSTGAHARESTRAPPG